MEKEKRLIIFSLTVPTGISYQLFKSYLFITNVKLLQMIAHRSLSGSSEVFAKWQCPTPQIVLTFTFSESQCWLTCIGPNHCCRLWGLNCRHTKWETYWVMSNQVTHSSKSSACIAKKKKKTCNYKYTTYPLHLLKWDVIINGFSNRKDYWNIICTAVILFVSWKHNMTLYLCFFLHFLRIQCHSLLKCLLFKGHVRLINMTKENWPLWLLR